MTPAEALEWMTNNLSDELGATPAELAEARAALQEPAEMANDLLAALIETIPFVELFPASTYEQQEEKDRVLRLASAARGTAIWTKEAP